MSNAEKMLFALFRERCYKEGGEFTLASGAKSDYYFDSKMAILSSAGAALTGEILYERTKDLDIEAIGGLVIGAVPLTAAAACTYRRFGRPIEGFFVRDGVKGHGTLKIIEGDLSHVSRVAIVDDVATSGKSIMKAVQAVRDIGCEPAIIIVLVDRRQGAKELFAKEGIPFCSIFTVDDFRNPAAPQEVLGRR